MTDRCKTCGQLPRRSSEQNRLYWSLLHEITEKVKPKDQAFNADTWHIYFKQRYLGSFDTTLPNGKIFTQPRSTVDLDKAQMNDYITKVEVFAAERGVYNDVQQ